MEDAQGTVKLHEVITYQKMLIALNFQYILYKTLKYSLLKLSKRGGVPDYYLRDFIEKFISIAYFRIPVFREKFIKLLVDTFNEEENNVSSNEVDPYTNEETKHTGNTSDQSSKSPDSNYSGNVIKNKKPVNDNEIDEWFRIEFPKKDNYKEVQKHKTVEEQKRRNEESSDSSDSDPDNSEVEKNEILKQLTIDSPYNAIINKKYEGAIAHIFDWDRYFYSHLPKDNEQKKENDKILEHILENTRWHDRIKKRGVGFLLIITEWAKYVKQAVIKRNIFWQDVPGYKTIVKAVLREIQKRPLLSYPDSLLDASMALLSNEKVMHLSN